MTAFRCGEMICFYMWCCWKDQHDQIHAFVAACRNLQQLHLQSQVVMRSDETGPDYMRLPGSHAKRDLKYCITGQIKLLRP